ncbi:unnamed protein product [Tetraodon nigroviridis]|uniref:(spotted green pufferfish) hypothetical protein n=2 Tax=Tetraodon nigroviridis TaxID=99883 RepID=Q4RF85_TETNG|nr:unnamed protein product [Tetraodon nigroviridis]
MAFFSASKANDAVKRLKSECATEIRTTVPTQMEDAEAGPSSQPSAPSSDDNLRHLLDVDVKKSRANSNVTTDAVVEVQRCISEANTPRSQDPLQYWQTQRLHYPNLYKLAMKFPCTPSSSVPCERVFSKAGEMVSKRRNRLGTNMLKQLMFWNKNA